MSGEGEELGHDEPSAPERVNPEIPDVPSAPVAAAQPLQEKAVVPQCLSPLPSVTPEPKGPGCEE